MENRNEEDIIKRITDAIRDRDEIPYREGAWERFKSSNPPKRRNWLPLAAAAILIAICGISGVIWLNSADVIDTQAPIAHEKGDRKDGKGAFGQEVDTHDRNGLIDSYEMDIENRLVTENDNRPQVGGLRPSRIEHTRERQYLGEGIFNASASQIAYSNIASDISPKPLAANPFKNIATSTPPPMIFSPKSGTELASETFGVEHDTKELKSQNRFVKLGERLSLGLLVAPSRTEQKTSFGGGLTLSFHVNENLSIRTGASYSQYEAGVLKDPIQSASTEVAVQADRLKAASAMTSSLAVSRYQPLIPNVNAIFGTVQALDVPLEVQYKFYKGFYASGGVSYASVLNQKRYAHYIENVQANPYSDGLPKNKAEMEEVSKAKTNILESATPNIQQNGFGGFVNFSVGKDINVRKSVSLSVEPYVKLPVGTFKRADMNFTNGGIRIITNF